MIDFPPPVHAHSVPSSVAFVELNSLQPCYLNCNHHRHNSLCPLSFADAHGVLVVTAQWYGLRRVQLAAAMSPQSRFTKPTLFCDNTYSVLVVMDGGRPSGVAFVEFNSPQEATTALSKNRQTMGTRYVEIFPANRSDLERYKARGGF